MTKDRTFRLPLLRLKAWASRRPWYVGHLNILAASYLILYLFQNINDMCQEERPDWQCVMAYVTAIYKHFEL